MTLTSSRVLVIALQVHQQTGFARLHQLDAVLTYKFLFRVLNRPSSPWHLSATFPSRLDDLQGLPLCSGSLPVPGHSTWAPLSVYQVCRWLLSYLFSFTRFLSEFQLSAISFLQVGRSTPLFSLLGTGLRSQKPSGPTRSVSWGHPSKIVAHLFVCLFSILNRSVRAPLCSAHVT